MKHMNEATSARFIDGDYSTMLVSHWWRDVTKCLVETVGSERALECLKPYWYNGGQASGFNLRRMTGITDNDVASITAVLMSQRSELVDDEGSPSWMFNARAGQYSAIIKVNKCGLWGLDIFPEICQIICDYGVDGTVEGLNPAYGCSLVKSICWGDSDCCWVIKRKDDVGSDENEDGFREIRPFKIIDALFDHLPLAYMGEFWITSTRAFLDAVPSKEVTQKLDGMLRKYGNEFGRIKKRRRAPDVDDLDLIDQTIESMGEAYNKNGRSIKISPEMYQKEIEVCPFSSAPPEVCLQFQSFYNGICESINPDIEFKYDRMMTKGDKTCHWTIRMKGLTKEHDRKGDVTPSPTMDGDLLKTLTTKYIQGEITEEDLERKLAHLRKLGLVK